MVKYYSADFVLPVSSAPIKNGVVAIDDTGEIQGIYEDKSVEVSDKEVVKLKGILVPGFINVHCHLELSHLAGKTDSNKGLPHFLGEVMAKREAKSDVILKAMQKADKAMFANGIQAVGDHVNTELSADIKNQSPIQYHTFVEVIGMSDDDVQVKIDQARDVEFHFDQEFSSITPHAPYSVSKKLFKAFQKTVNADNLLSVHNQESDEENKLFRYRTGEFIDFYEKHNIPFDHFKAQARNSLQSYLSYLPKANKVILVHNTHTSVKDLDYVERMNRNVVICLCPKSNLHVEGTLPKVHNFILNREKIVIGTDSLASNDTLDILEELKTLYKAFPDLDFLTMLRWATLNGAEALNLEENIGSIEVGKRPGLVLLENMRKLQLTEETRLQRIV